MGIDNLDFVTRHSTKPKGDDLTSNVYEGISEKGVDLAKERAHEILETVESLPEGGVLVLGGASELARTKATMNVYSDELKRLVAEAGRKDIKVMDMEDIRALANADQTEDSKVGMTAMLEKLAAEIQRNPDTKFVLAAPMFLKEFAMARWTDAQGNFSEFTNKLMEKAGGDMEKAVELWFESRGTVDGLNGPVPNEVAKEHLHGIGRLRDFVNRFLQGRSVSIGAVGHSWNADALVAYLANNGDASAEWYRNAVGGKMIGETEMFRVETDGDETKLVYGKRLAEKIDPKLLGNSAE